VPYIRSIAVAERARSTARSIEVSTSHLSTLDLFFVAGPAVLVILASIIGLAVAIVQDIRESRIY